MSKLPKRFLILHNPHVEGSDIVAQEISDCLRTRHRLDADCVTPDVVETVPQLEDVDLLVAVGGDGNMLRVGRLGGRCGCPVLGVNLGRVGFLPQVQLDDWSDAIARTVSGDFWLEKRMMVYAEHWREGICLSGHHSLNEVVVTRGALARPVRMEAIIDSSKLTTYMADGLIVSTPTGSTAYALAAGGPILPPDLRNLMIIPIAPHLSIDRAIVLAEGTRIDLTVHTDHEAILSADGQIEIKLQDSDSVHVRASDRSVSFVRLEDKSYFYRNLTARLVFKEHEPR